MVTAARCTGCGSTIHEGDEVCAYCRSATRPLAAAPPVRPTADQERREVFARLRASPEFAGLMAEPERSHDRSGGSFGRDGMRLLLGVAFGLLALLLVRRPTAGVLGAILGVGIGTRLARRSFVAPAAFLAEPARRFPARLIAKRTEIAGHGRRLSTRYFVTLEREDGIRTELVTDGGGYGLACEGDAGVAAAASGRLIGFTVIPV